MNYNLEKFESGLKHLGISLDEKQMQQFLDYYEFLIETNKTLNLTRITEFDDVIEKHFLDSLALCQYVDLNQPVRILDLGTGAGFPGIPLKIAFPALEITLCDSLNKRVKFLQEVIERLSLEKITAVHGRAEELAANKEYREQYDFCLSRAVANLSTLSEYCIPFVKIGGYFVSYKSGEIEEELSQAKKAIHILGGRLEDTKYFQLPDSDVHRAFVMIKKLEVTKKVYPRKAGTPSKNPLS